MRRRPRKRSQTEGHAAASHHIAVASIASSPVASSPVAAAGPDRIVPTASRRKRRVPFSRKLLRSKSAPYRGGDAGTESIRSDETPPVPPRRPSVVAPALQSIGSEGRSDVDDGVPSQSAFSDLQRVMKLIEDERHLAAHELYLDARRRVEDSRREMGRDNEEDNDKQQAKNKRGRVWWTGIGNATTDATDEEKAWKFLQERKEEFEALENRATLFAAAKENLSIDDDWIHAQTLFGVATSYRREADGSLSVKIEGELHGVPLFEQLVVLRECDLYDTWAPFTSKSKKLAQLDKLDVVAWYIVGVPALGLTRDACYRAVGCDSMREDGSVLLVAVGLNDTEEYGVKDALKEEGGTRQQMIGEAEREELRQQMAVPSESNLFDTTNSSFLARDAIMNTLEIPPIPSGMGRGRMTIRNFVASIDILAPTAARTKMVVNVDPNLPLIPQFMIDFCMKRMCGILLSRLQATARKVVRDPVNNQHARRMREDVHFYRDWLLPRFELYCNELGWQMPPVGAFEVDEEALEAEGTGWIGDSLESDTQIASIRSQLDEDSSHTRTLSSSSDGSKETNFLRKIVRAKSASREEKISSARQRASQRLRPNPFSKSKAERLNELKAAKLRAEERRRLRTFSEDSVSSLRTLQTLQDVDLEGEVTRQSLLFGVSFTIHTALLLLRQDALLRLSEWGLPAQEVLDLMLILLQAASLWALLASSVIFAFEEIDFGQRRLVENMGIGRRLFADQVRRASLLAALLVAIISCGVGLFVQCVCSEEASLPLVLPGLARRGIDVFSSPLLRVCDLHAPSSNQWSSRALRISSFVTVRVGVFVLALMLMGKLLLPKPRKRSKDDGRKKDRRSDADIRSVGSSLNDSQQGAQGYLSSMDVIAEESSGEPKMIN